MPKQTEGRKTMLVFGKWIMFGAGLFMLLAILPVARLFPAPWKFADIANLSFAAVMCFRAFMSLRSRIGHPVVSTITVHQSNLRAAVFWTILLSAAAVAVLVVRRMQVV